MTRTARTVEACIADLPKTIKIGAYDWQVVALDDASENYGQADFDTSAIRIWPKNIATAEKVVGIFLHECYHVMFDNHGLGQLKRDKEDREEQIVLAFEAGMVSLLRDNPKLLMWMKKYL
ncbi:hypothetical protein [Bradyrhizobium sp. Tv2a-2]|uniref:hypothetical protein n=1 Tax=Bradyrhizobium sp. Tv2a-2 TaxID=113395 RepID=UPI0003FD7936|nr:hypothetical protein [Bradyrhizobium sp. Tv2a-2]